jgi:hypothetical protein
LQQRSSHAAGYQHRRGPAGAVVRQYLDRIVRDLDACRHRHVISQLDTDLWRETLKRLGVPQKLAGPTVDTLEKLRSRFDPHEPSSHSAVRAALEELSEFWSD